MLLLNGSPISYFKFSGGEIQVKLPEHIATERVHLEWKPTTCDDIMLLLLTVNALYHAGISDIDVDVLYLPYARQDRVCATGEAYSLEVMIGILNSMPVTMLRFWDLHNPYILESLDHCAHETEIYDIFKRFNLMQYFDMDNIIPVAPDQGACEKVYELVTKCDFVTSYHLRKKRDCDTGKIFNIEPTDPKRDISEWDMLIVDDICDGGATFIEAAKLLQTKGVRDIYLYVTHGIFSKGLEELQKYFKHVYCHHVLHDDKYQSSEFLTILKEFPHVS